MIGSWLTAKEIIKRPIFEQVVKYLPDKDILLILGSRQVGKTSLLWWLMKFIDVHPENIFYFDLENPSLPDKFNSFEAKDFYNFLVAEKADTSKRIFVFIDEIQYLDDPGRFLKPIHDYYPNIKLIISGSSSLDIRRKFKQTLTGRKKVIELMPLTFYEFLLFKKHRFCEDKKELSLDKIIKECSLPSLEVLRFQQEEFLKEFEEFICFGGYPEVNLLKTREEKILKLEDIYTTYVRRDIRDLMKIENIRAFNKLVELLSFQIGQLINIDQIATETRAARETIEKYLFLLETTFIIHSLRPYFNNPRKEIVKSSKIYFEDTGLRNCVVKNFTNFNQRFDKGNLFENAVFAQLKKNLNLLEELHYWRTKTKAEVDFILKGGRIVPIEIKTQVFLRPQVPSGLRSFINQYSPEVAVVITSDFFAHEQIYNTNVFFLPAWVI